MKTTNGLIACTPFESHSIKTEVSRGMVSLKNKNELLAIKVVFDDDGQNHVGDTLYVRGEVVAHDWAKRTYELDGQTFILVPKEFVVAVDRW